MMCYHGVIQLAGKQNVGWSEVDFGGWLGGKWNGVGIQLVGSSWAKKNDCSEIENLWYVVVQLFVHMYRRFEVVE